MLVLSRKVGERIRIGLGIIVTVREIKGNKVRLAIAAPRSENIVRDELLPRDGALLAQLGEPLRCGDCCEEVQKCRCGAAVA